jgi:hypothetical protein
VILWSGRLRGLLVVGVCSVAAGALCALPRVAEAQAKKTTMACLNARTGDSNVYVSAPRSCIVHFSNKPLDGNDEAAVGKIRWLSWGSSVGVGRGIFAGNMGYKTTSTLTVSHPHRCPNGTWGYTEATITTQGLPTFSGPLSSCGS